MLLEVDEAALEWKVAAELSRDKTMVADIQNGVDPHGKVLRDVFKGKGERVQAKVFNFRQIYQDERKRGYGYYMDPDMPKMARKAWDKIVDDFYGLYSGFSSGHTSQVRLVNRQGYYEGPTGRKWVFERTMTRYGLEYDRGKIYNYIVQGTSADVVKLYMVNVCSSLEHLPKVKLINCVHDSLIFDLPEKHVDEVSELCYSIGEGQAKAMGDWFGIDWVVPLAVEVKVGPTWAEMSQYERRSNVQGYYY